MLAFRVVVQEFDDEVGDAMMELDSRSIINAFSRTLKDLALQAVTRDDAAQAWLSDRVDRLTTPSSDKDA